MGNKSCIIITSINNSENTVLQNYAKQCIEKNIGFILAGDTKSPKDFNLKGCEFLSVQDQKQLPFTLAALLPDCNYAKKNIAYLQAIKKGYSILIETDDDNIPTLDFWTPRETEIKGDFLGDKNWVNVYGYFSDSNIWPRGFLLNQIKKPLPNIQKNQTASYFCPIQQALVDENPDVDAIFRLTRELPIYFNKRDAIILGNSSICPFNSQNTTWFKQAFPLLYLPSYCSFRMTDIWRSFIAQRILWTCDWNLAFYNANMYQKRNEHDLMKDFEDEISGYLNNDSIMKDLCNLDLKSGENNIFENLLLCYKMLVDKKHFDERELPLINAWLSDLSKI